MFFGAIRLYYADFRQARGLDGFEAAYAHNREAPIDVMPEHDLLTQSVKAIVATTLEWQGVARKLLVLIDEAARSIDIAHQPRKVTSAESKSLEPSNDAVTKMAHELGYCVHLRHCIIEMAAPSETRQGGSSHSGMPMA